MKIACGEIKAWEQECKNKNGKRISGEPSYR